MEGESAVDVRPVHQDRSMTVLRMARHHKEARSFCQDPIGGFLEEGSGHFHALKTHTQKCLNLFSEIV